MNLLVLSINYAPEPTGFAPHVTALCEHLARQGHAVTVLTGFPFAPYWARWREYRGKIIARERVKDVLVVRMTHYIPRYAGNLLQRILLEASFSAMALWVAVTQARVRWDLVLYVGAQPSIAMAARALANLFHIPYVVNIQDLAAQAAAGVGIVKATWLARLLERFEYAAYRGARGAIVLCQAFQTALVAHGYPAERIRVIRSPVDVQAIRPVPPDAAFRAAHAIAPADFVILFAGSMGLKQGLGNVIDAARLVRDDAPSVKWVLVGEGESKAELQKLVAARALGDVVRVLPLQPESAMSAMFASADVLLLNQVSSVKDTVIPSKLLTYMAAGKPALAAVSPSSQAAELLRDAGGGMIVAPEDPRALADGARRLMADLDALREMGRCNRRYAEEYFDQRKIVAAQEAFLIHCRSEASRAVPRDASPLPYDSTG